MLPLLNFPHPNFLHQLLIQAMLLLNFLLSNMLFPYLHSQIIHQFRINNHHMAILKAIIKDKLTHLPTRFLHSQIKHQLLNTNPLNHTCPNKVSNNHLHMSQHLDTTPWDKVNPTTHLKPRHQQPLLQIPINSDHLQIHGNLQAIQIVNPIRNNKLEQVHPQNPIFQFYTLHQFQNTSRWINPTTTQI